MGEVYLFHQTPFELAKDLLKDFPFEDGDTVLEPFKGEGAFYNNFPDNVIKEWCEIEEGKDYTEYTGQIDWVITNPPFRLEDSNGKRVNSFWFLLNYYKDKVNKGICFLANDYCLGTLTPIRLKILNESGLYLTKITVANVKKWRGRYYFITFTRTENVFYKYLIGSY